jgi:hypothetical protein
MELIDRYLQAVKFALPKAQQEDIIKELSDDILSQVEEKEAEFGRPLNEAEQVEMLKQYGPPTLLASRYRKQQHLIGPAVFPVYWKVLKAALLLALVVQVIASIALAASGQPFLSSLQVLFRYPVVAIMVFAWMTVVFAAIDFFGAKLHPHDRWDPRKLPALVKGEHAKSRPELATGLVIVAIATVWWLAGLHNPYLVFGPGAAFFTFAPVWLKIYPLFVLVGLVEVARICINIARPFATPFHTAARLVTTGLSLLVLYFLIRAGDVFAVADAADASRLGPVLRSINYGTHLGLIIAAIAFFATILAGVWRLIGTRIDQTVNAIVA